MHKDIATLLPSSPRLHAMRPAPLRATQQLAAAVDDDGFCSAKGTTKRQPVLELGEILAEQPDDGCHMTVQIIPIKCNNYHLNLNQNYCTQPVHSDRLL